MVTPIPDDPRTFLTAMIPCLSFIEAVREPDGGGNFDVIDGLFDVGGNCIFLFDLTSPNLDFFNGVIFPESER
ncbi:MAG: hypothetical protein IIA27_07550 [Gemmatimonadetes bacterium]|nr:hypothetical protein [Gemmatimonadota bacterium]